MACIRSGWAKRRGSAKELAVEAELPAEWFVRLECNGPGQEGWDDVYPVPRRAAEGVLRKLGPFHTTHLSAERSPATQLPPTVTQGAIEAVLWYYCFHAGDRRELQKQANVRRFCKSLKGIQLLKVAAAAEFLNLREVVYQATEAGNHFCNTCSPHELRAECNLPEAATEEEAWLPLENTHGEERIFAYNDWLQERLMAMRGVMDERDLDALVAFVEGTGAAPRHRNSSLEAAEAQVRRENQAQRNENQQPNRRPTLYPADLRRVRPQRSGCEVDEFGAQRGAGSVRPAADALEEEASARETGACSMPVDDEEELDEELKMEAMEKKVEECKAKLRQLNIDPDASLACNALLPLRN